MFIEVYDSNDNRLLINIRSIAYIGEYSNKISKITCNDGKTFYIILVWEDLQKLFYSQNFLISLTTEDGRL